MELPVGFVSILITLERSLRLCLLAGLHPFRYELRQPALADHLQNVLAIKFPVHQHVIDVDELFSRIQQILGGAVPVTELLLRVAWNRDICILGF